MVLQSIYLYPLVYNRTKKLSVFEVFQAEQFKQTRMWHFIFDFSDVKVIFALSKEARYFFCAAFTGYSISVYTFRENRKSRHSREPLTTASSKYGLFIRLYASSLINLNDKFLFRVDINIIFDFEGLCIIRIKAFHFRDKGCLPLHSLGLGVIFFICGDAF